MKTFKNYILVSVLACVFVSLFSGCGGYSDEWLYRTDVSSVFVEMFENRTFRRDLEYTLTDAIVKRIEAETPYKVISDRSRADTVLSGEIVEISESVLAGERQTGQPLEKQATVIAKITWKNLKTNEDIVKDMQIKASQSFSEFQDQQLDYAKAVAANKLAERIVEVMQLDW